MPDPLDPELAEGISLAKKKPMSFALIAKGTEPVKLIIQKKVIKEGAIAKAKSTYKGNLVISGVCTGSGAQLEFQVVGEANAEPSIKTKKIKDFISEQAGLTIMPSWKCVSELPNVDADDAPAGPTGESQAPPPAPTPPTPPVPPAPPAPSAAGGEAKSLLAMLSKLSTTIQGAVAAHPARRTEIVGFVASFKKEVEGEQFEPAKKTLKSLMVLLKELGVAIPGAPPAPGAAPPTPTGAPPAQESAPPPPPPRPTAPSALATRWQQEYGSLEEDYLKALKKADSKLKSQLEAVYAFFAAPASFEDEDEAPKTEQEQDKAYERALKALDKLKPLVAQALAVPGPGGATSEVAKGTVEKRKFLLERWRQIPGEVDANLNKLKSEIGKQVPDEDPDELMDGIQSMLGEFYEEMRDSIDDSINAGTDDAVRKSITAMRGRVRQNKLIQLLMKNPLDNGVDVEGVLMSALDEIENRLAS